MAWIKPRFCQTGLTLYGLFSWVRIVRKWIWVPTEYAYLTLFIPRFLTYYPSRFSCVHGKIKNEMPLIREWIWSWAIHLEAQLSKKLWFISLRLIVSCQLDSDCGNKFSLKSLIKYNFQAIHTLCYFKVFTALKTTLEQLYRKILLIEK